MINDDWRTSSYSNTGGNCVQIRLRQSRVEVRDSQNPDAGTLSLSGAELSSVLTAAIKGMKGCD